MRNLHINENNLIDQFFRLESLLHKHFLLKEKKLGPLVVDILDKGEYLVYLNYSRKLHKKSDPIY